jgi:bifunctional DNA-binding transcriptional regulator/antitoxin component of YhaV-PrlF toxin-antitoxin module
MKIQKNVDQYFITLPKKIVEGMEWEKGDDIQVKVDSKNSLKLVKNEK